MERFNGTSQSANNRIFKDQLLTIDDLIVFKNELLLDIKRLFKELGGQPSKKWLKSSEVRKMLDISPGTLQTLRNNGTIPFTKVGGVLYYSKEAIEDVLVNSNKKAVHKTWKAAR